MVNGHKSSIKGQRLAVGGRKALSVDLEDVLLKWIYSRCEQGLRVS